MTNSINKCGYTVKSASLHLLFLAIISAGCSKLTGDDPLVTPLQPYTGTELRMDGYYVSQEFYHQRDQLIFYRNGVMIYTGTWLLKDTLDTERVYRSLEWVARNREDKGIWGVFQVDGSKFAYDRWYAATIRYTSSVSSGAILNDTTFAIITPKESGGGDSFFYYFRHFDPKPDSSNNFIP